MSRIRIASDVRRVLVLPLGAALACLASAPVVAGQCPAGQIYRVSKKACMPKDEAVKLGIYHGAGEATAPVEKPAPQPAPKAAPEAVDEDPPRKTPHVARHPAEDVVSATPKPAPEPRPVPPPPQPPAAPPPPSAAGLAPSPFGALTIENFAKPK